MKLAKENLSDAPLEFFAEDDLADSTLHFEANGGGGFSVGFVGIGVAVELQTVDFDGTDSSGGMGDDPDVFRQANLGLTYAAFDVGSQIGFSVTGEVDIHWTRIRGGSVNPGVSRAASYSREL